MRARARFPRSDGGVFPSRDRRPLSVSISKSPRSTRGGGSRRCRRWPSCTSSQTFAFILVISIVLVYLGPLITRRPARFPLCLFFRGSAASTTMDDGHGEPASLAHSLACAFPDTPSYLAHFSLHYYRDEVRGASSKALPWISKSLRLGDPPLVVLARYDFEAPTATWLSSKSHSKYLDHLVGLEAGRVTAIALLGELGEYVPRSIVADGFTELCEAVFEAYVETCDVLDLCARLREVLIDGVGTGGDDEEVEGVRRALEDLELQVRFARVACILCRQTGVRVSWFETRIQRAGVSIRGSRPTMASAPRAGRPCRMASRFEQPVFVVFWMAYRAERTAAAGDGVYDDVACDAPGPGHVQGVFGAPARAVVWITRRTIFGAYT